MLANSIALLLILMALLFLGIALLWRIGSWGISTADLLNTDYGLPIGGTGHQLAAYRGTQDWHLSFVDAVSFIVFGARDCDPCKSLLVAATHHPATRSMRLVYIGDSEEVDLPPDIVSRWETYRFHAETQTRMAWNAPVSPFYHVVNAVGAIVAKGTASQPVHLDYLLTLPPAHTPAPELLSLGAERTGGSTDDGP